MGAQRVKLSSEDQFIQEAIRAGRATVQNYSLKQLIKLDKAMQPRVNHLNVEHAKNLTDTLQNLRKLDRDLDPGVLFRDPKTNWIGLVDGWHRLHAYMTIRPKLDYFPAYVVEGTKEEAIEYAAMANQHARLKRTTADVEKQLHMLFAIPRWWNKSNQSIGDHVGINPTTVHRHRVNYSRTTSTPIPNVFVSASGQLQSTRVSRGQILSGTNKPPISRDCNGKYSAKILGKTHSLGRRDMESASEQLDEKLASIRAEIASRRHSLRLSNLGTFLAARELSFRVTKAGGAHHGVSGLSGHGRTITTAYLQKDDDSAVRSFGPVLAIREFDNPANRAVVVCYPEDGPEEILDIGRRLGIEFLTPEQLVASIKGDGDGDNDPAPAGEAAHP